MQQEDNIISNKHADFQEVNDLMSQKQILDQSHENKYTEENHKHCILRKFSSQSFTRQSNNYNNLDSDNEFDTEEAIRSAFNTHSSSTIKLASLTTPSNQDDNLKQSATLSQKNLQEQNFSNNSQYVQQKKVKDNQNTCSDSSQIEYPFSLSKIQTRIGSLLNCQQTSLENIAQDDFTSQDAQFINEFGKKKYLNLKNSNQIEVMKRMQIKGLKNNQFMQKLDEIPQINMDDLNLKNIKQDSVKSCDFQKKEENNATQEGAHAKIDQQIISKHSNHQDSQNIQKHEKIHLLSQNNNKQKYTHTISQISQKFTQKPQKLKDSQQNSFNLGQNSSPNSNECIPSNDQDNFSLSESQQINDDSYDLEVSQEKMILENELSGNEQSNSDSKPSHTSDKRQNDFLNQKKTLDDNNDHEDEEEISQNSDESKQQFVSRITDSSSLFWKQFTEKDDDYLLSLYEKLDKNNVNKNILSAFLKYILDDGDNVVVECLDSKQKDLNIIRKELKNFTRNKKLNNNTINSFFNSQRYSEQFQYFLKFYAIDYFTKSKVKDKASHYICIAFFLRCFFNNKLREKIVVYNKSKYFKSLHKNRYSTKSNSNAQQNNDDMID